jgi:hypothetical protein
MNAATQAGRAVPVWTAEGKDDMKGLAPRGFPAGFAALSGFAAFSLHLP